MLVCRGVGANYYVLLAFAPVLVVTGFLGFVIPEDKSPTSGALPYNIFHLISGATGLAVLYTGDATWARAFNLGFGLIDLYQAAASFFGWFPRAQFKWKRADDILHIIIGVALVSIGLLGK